MGVLDEEECDETERSVLSKTYSEDAIIQCLDMADYKLKEIYLRLSQIFDKQCTFHVIEGMDFKDLPNSMRTQGLHYGHK